MADGYSRLSGKIGLASTTQGPGYANATTSLVYTRLHRSPVLMLAGHASLRDPYNPQGMLDQHAMAKLTTGATVKIDHADNVDYCLGEAFRQLKAKKGPFVLNMPQDVQHAALPDEKWTYRPMYKAKILQPPRPEDVAEAAKILASAKRPTILCGLGAAEGKAEPEVQKLAEYLGAPVATSLYAAGFCAQYPLYLGISGGLGSDLAVDTLAESDAMIVVGASLNEWTTHFGKILENGKKIIQIDDREDAFGWFARITVGLEADAKVAVAALLDQLKEGGKPGRQPDAETVQKIKQRKPPAITYDDGKWVDPRRAARLSGRQAAETGSHSRVRRRPLRNGDCSGPEQPQRRQLGVRTGFRRDWARLGHRAWRLFCATRQADHPSHRGCFVHDERRRFPHRGQSQPAAHRFRVQRQRRWTGAARPRPQGLSDEICGSRISPISKNWPSVLAPRASESIGPMISARSIKRLRSKTAR